ncbi:hypothetical protein J2T09_002800 [Neorhizobium huautlense]|uniref:Transposase n=1 Tax=Neorhizobium huautlense TaxID=67774 RepID=A0ABT9PV28_9HYPH|nr:hypothetical protein [Neorhizobium huautlense]MDP9838040.1 hypothetical protein [Neorhizobium huautlense]
MMRNKIERSLRAENSQARKRSAYRSEPGATIRAIAPVAAIPFVRPGK